MRDSVRAGFIAFSSPLEGVVPWLYTDILGLVTVGIGCLVDPIEYALPLPFVRPDGTYADSAEIALAWHAVKEKPELAKQGSRAAEHVTTIRLTAEGVEHVVFRKLDQMQNQLLKRFPAFEDWPADAQLATLSMSWACGPAFHFPNLELALLSQQFAAAADACTINEAGNPGVKPRNVANRMLYRNAGKVVAFKLNPETLYYKNEPPSEPPPPIKDDVAQEDTEPNPILALADIADEAAKDYKPES